MPFGFINAPATFQAYINRALMGFINYIYVIYFDDIFIYFKNKNEYINYVK